MMQDRNVLRAKVIATAVAAMSASSLAAEIPWAGGASGDATNFSNAANWVGGVAPVNSSLGTGDTAVLPSPVTADQPSLTANYGVRGLRFETDGWTLGGTGLTLSVAGIGQPNGAGIVTLNSSGTNTINSHLAISSADQAATGFDVATGGTLVVKGDVSRINLSGGGSIVKAGGGTLELQGGGSLSFRVDAGTVKAVSGTGMVDNSSSNQSLSLQGTSVYDLVGINIRIKDFDLASGATITSSSSTTRSLTMKVAGSRVLSGMMTGNLSMGYGTNGSAYNLTVVRNDHSYTGATSVNGVATVIVDTLANGGVASSIGQSSNAAQNLVLNGGTLRYTGPAVTTDRGFTVMNNGGFEANGTGAMVVTGAMAAGQNQFNSATFKLLGSNTGANTIASAINNGTSGRNIGLAKSGSGTWVLTGSSNYSLGTTISGGRLLIDNLTGSGTGTGAVALNAGTLGGTGAISGSVTIGNGTGVDDSTLAPGTIGTSIESLNVGALTFNSDGVFAAELNSSLIVADSVVASGAVALGDGIALLQLSDLGNAVLPANTVLTLMSSTVGVSGYFRNLAPVNNVGPQVTVGSNLYQLDYGTNNVTLTVVPEPMSVGIIGLLGCASLLRRRR